MTMSAMGQKRTFQHAPAERYADQTSACRTEAQNLFGIPNNALPHSAMGTIRAWVSDGRSI